jgi:acyl-coenzyme A thioesterase 9
MKLLKQTKNLYFLKKNVTINKQKIINNLLSKNYSARILSPNSLLFNHKKNIDRAQKFMTHMCPPKNLIEKHMTKEMDFEPGLGYFQNQNTFDINLFEREDSEKTPEAGFVQIIIPFDTNPSLQNDYRLLHTNRIRNGKLLELLDYLSALSAYRYNSILPKSKVATFVTASVDNIEIKIFELKNPLIINAYPTWTGASSMEIRMDLFLDRSHSDDTFLGSAFFMYVMRDGEDYSKKKLTFSLKNELIQDAKEREKANIRFEIGLENKKQRIFELQTSLDRKAPNQEESEFLHKIFVDHKNHSLTKYKTIKETQIDKSILMHSQNMNVNGHVFGGYIIKEALDAGYVCAYMHNNREIPIVFAIDNVTFYKPVIIGSVAKFSACVCYVHEELIHVAVEVYNYINDIPTLTTVINITYKTSKKTENVIPASYECGMKFLEAKRRIEKIFDYY